MFSARNIIVLLIIFAASGFAFLLLRQSSPPIIAPSPTPTESSNIVTIQSVPEIETSEVHSPDGKMKLIMEKTANGENMTYSFSVSETAQNIRNEIYSKTVLPGTNFDLFPNAWSPENKYFFITEENITSVDYFVFKANGESISSSEQYINVVPLFVARNTGFTLSEITGWDSETLLHIYTTREDGSRGASFWFEIPSKAIIQLASR